MAVYTDVTDDDLLPFLAAYGLQEPVAFKGIAEGVENSNYYVGFEDQAAILTLYERRTRAEDLPFFLSLMQHLHHQGLPVPLPYAQTNGALLGTLAGRPAALISFLPGLSVRKPTRDHCAQLGTALARLHVAAQSFPLQRLNSMGRDAWGPLIQACDGQPETLQTGAMQMIWQALEDVHRQWPEGLPAGIIHADLFPNNVLFRGTDVSGLIDFYFAATDLFAYDVAIALNAWCFEPDVSYNITKGRALLDGYQSVRRLESTEVYALPLLCQAAALRFLATRLYDWFHRPAGALVKPHDPVEYMKKLHFHRDVNSARAYGVESK